MKDTTIEKSEQSSAPVKETVPFFARYMQTLKIKVQSGIKAGAPRARRPA
jgi:hypothetical protein